MLHWIVAGGCFMASTMFFVIWLRTARMERNMRDVRYDLREQVADSKVYNTEQSITEG